MDEAKIYYDDFRKEWKISSAALKSICKSLEIEITKDEEGKSIISNYNKFTASNGIKTKELLDIAIKEFRATADIINTETGAFLRDEARYMLSKIDKDEINIASPHLIREPNKKSSSLIVQKEADAPVGITAPIPAPNPALETLLEALTAAQRPTPPPDPLKTQRQLLEAEKHGFLITTEQLGQLLGMSKSTISSKKSGFRKMGFEFQRIKEGSTTLWRASRYKIK